MSILLTLTGQLDSTERLSRADARDWLADASVWFESRGDAVLDAHVVLDGENRPVLLVSFHPATPPVEVRLTANRKLRVTAITTPAGPGYHIHLCDLLREFAQSHEVNWIADDCNDPTDYFRTRNREQTEAAFLQWLAETCGTQPAHIGLPASHGFTFPAEVYTPLGPRTHAWVTAVANQPEQGRDFFAWWKPELDAAFYRGRALVRLWCDFYWRPPLSEDEGELADQIANDLASAFKIDPSCELPWAEWLELLAAIEGDEEHYCVTPTDVVLSIELWKRTGPLPESTSNDSIGYRRHAVRVPLEGGWSVEVPGELVCERNADHTWTAWDHTRTIWFQALRFTKPGGEAPTATEAAEVGRRSLPEGNALPAFAGNGLRGEAVFSAVEEEGRVLWRLSGITGAPGQIAVCNVYIENETDRDWAIRTWHSLRHASTIG
jgi:hypothetical protein